MTVKVSIIQIVRAVEGALLMEISEKHEHQRYLFYMKGRLA